MTIETKYNIGDEVWGKRCNTLYKLTIKGFVLKKVETYLDILYITVEDSDNIPLHFEEQELFPTKEELLKSL